MPSRGYFHIPYGDSSERFAQESKKHRISPLSFILALLLAIVMRLIYGYRVCPVLAVGDSGELATAAWTNGVAHPPGYPLFTLLGRYFAHLRFHSPSTAFEPGIFDQAFRMNMLSLWLGVATVVIVYLILERALKNPFVAFLGAFIFGAGRTFLSQSLAGEVYTLHALITALVIYTLLLIDEKPTSWRLCILALLLGLGLSNHSSTLLMFVPILFFIWMTIRVRGMKIRKNLVLSTLIFFFIGLLPYLYLPIASHNEPYLDWGNPETISNFVKVVTRSEFRQIKESIQHTEQSVGFSGIARAFRFWQRESFGRLFTLLGYLGLFAVLVKGKRFGLLLALCFIFMTVPYFIYFRNIPREDLFYLEVYYIPAHLMFAIFTGFFISFAVETIPQMLRKRNIRHMASLAIFVFFTVVVCVSWFGHGSRFTMRDHTIGARYPHDVLRDIPFGSILVTSGDEPFLFWYLQRVAQFRDDVVVLETDTLMKTRSWYWDSVRREYPDLNIPDMNLFTPEPDLEAFAAEFHRLNPNRPLFFTSIPEDLHPELIGFTFVPDGLLFALGSKDESGSIIMHNTPLSDGLFASPLDFASTNLDPYEEELLERYLFAFFNYGNFYLSKGDGAKAKETLMRIFNLKPEFQPPGFLPVAGILARNMIREGDLDGASNVLGKLIATGHADSAWYYLYAQMLVQANQIEDAVKILKDGLAKDPENQFLQSLLNQLIQPSENEEIPVDDSQSEDTNVDV